MPIVSMRVSDQLYSHLKEIAKDRRLTVGGTARVLVEEAMQAVTLKERAAMSLAFLDAQIEVLAFQKAQLYAADDDLVELSKRFKEELIQQMEE